MAYDINRFDTCSIDEWMKLWGAREFGAKVALEVSEIITTFSRYASWRKFELVDASTYSVINYNEADIVLEKWKTLLHRAKTVAEKLNPADYPAFFETVLYPIEAAYIVYAIHINTARNNLFVTQKRNKANDAAYLILDFFRNDSLLTDTYHDLLDGKWNHIMDQTHLGYEFRQQPMRDAITGLGFVQSLRSALPGNVGLSVEGNYTTLPGDDEYHEYKYGMSVSTPPMDPYGPQTRYIDIFARGNVATEWELHVSHPCIKLSSRKGLAGGKEGTDCRVEISIDWDNAPEDSFVGTVNATFSGEGAKHHNWVGTSRGRLTIIYVPVERRYVPSSFVGHVESDGHISMEAEHISRNISVTDSYYRVLPHFGHSLSGLTLWPVTIPSGTVEQSPGLEYDIYVFSDVPEAEITIYLAPSLNFRGDDDPLKYAIAIDSFEAQEVQFVSTGSGVNMPDGWLEAVADNVWKSRTTHKISKGFHTVKLWALQPNVVFQKLVIDFGGVRESYFGPPESYRKTQQPVQFVEQGNLDMPNLHNSIAFR